MVPIHVFISHIQKNTIFALKKKSKFLDEEKHFLAIIAFVMASCNSNVSKTENNMENQKPVPGTDGNKYVPYEQRTGEEAVVYFTRDLSAEGLIKAYEKVNGNIEGNVGVKLHTGEQNGPNIIPREWVRALMEKTSKTPPSLKLTPTTKETATLQSNIVTL